MSKRIIQGGAPDQEHDLAVGDLNLVSRVGEPDAMVALEIDVGARLVGQARVKVEAEVVIMNRSVGGETLTGNHAGIMVQPARAQCETRWKRPVGG